MLNICVNLPDGMSTFIKVVPTDGSVALTAEFIKEVLLSSAIEASVQQHPLEEFYTSQNGRNVVCACHLQGDALLTRERSDVYVNLHFCLQVYGDESGELSDSLLGFVGDGESADKAAMADLEGEYPFLVNIWCQAHCMSLLLKVRPVSTLYSSSCQQLD